MKKVIIVLSLLCHNLYGYCQSEEIVKEKKTLAGFNIGGFHTLVRPAQEPLPDNFKINNGEGFLLGVFLQQKITNRVWFSPKSELSFSNNSISYMQEPGLSVTNSIYSTNLAFMAHIIISSNLKLKPFVSLGPSIRVPLTKDDEFNLNSKNDIGFDISFGLNKAFSNFNILPELRLSTGFNNLIESDNLPKVRYNSVSLIINFMG